MWGLYSVGPFRTTLGGNRFILVVVDKFTKWIEVRPVAKVTSEEAVKFMQDITHHFGVPNRIITDLGTAFTGSAFWDFCQDNTIDVYYSSVAHPWCNGQVERVNGMDLQAIKDRIFEAASNYATWWLAEPPHVIWVLRTQVSSATGSHPFYWSMAQRAYYQPTSLLELHTFNSTRREKMSNLVVLTSIALKNKG
jgi:transposase InsO family protein